MRVLALMLMLLTTPALAQTVTVGQVLANAVEKAIRPGFAALAAESAELEAALVRLCKERTQETLAAARGQFAQVVTSHARVEFLRLGPMVAENRAERLLFWPDRKGIALRQVQQVLAEEDETATDEATLRGKSVALQGLGALEFVLHGSGAAELVGSQGDFRCRYGAAIAAAIETVAAELAAEWLAEDGFARQLAEPQAESPSYRSEREALEALTGVMSHGIEAIRDTRLLPFLGRDGDEPKPKAAPYWRSGLTIASIEAGFVGIEMLFDASRIGEATPDAQRWVASGVAFEFANVERAADAVTLPFEAALADEAQRRAMGYLVILSQSLQALLGESLAAALGLSVGFSSLDGD